MPTQRILPIKVLLLLAACLLLASARPLVARAAGAGADTDVPSDVQADDSEGGDKPPQVLDRNLFSILRSGGVMMIPIFACSFLLLVFVFERAISLRRGRVVPGPFVKRFLNQLREGKFDRDQALDLCQESQSPVSEVFAAAVKKWGRPSVELEQTVIDAEERVASGLRRYVRLFNAVANISPLFGLLGTVFGMIRLFGEISSSNAMGRTELLAGGISEALLATAGGLSVAIPALCFYVFFVSRVERLVMEIDALAQEVVGLISAEAAHDERQKSARTSRRGAAA